MSEQAIGNVALIGLGAIGMVAATRFQEVMPDGFRIIADSERQKRIHENGVWFNDRRYDFTFATPGWGPADLILIATKSNGLEAALEEIAPYVGPQTVILPLLNGITSEEITGSYFGVEKVLHALFIGNTSTRTGNHIAMTGGYRFQFGEPTNQPPYSQRVQRIASLFDRVEIHYRIPEDMVRAMWQKYVINIGMNQATALLRKPYGHLQHNPAARELTQQLMIESAAVARVSGVGHTETMVDEAMRLLDKSNPDDKSSMLQDVEAGRTSEYNLFAGELCTRADALGVDTPMNRAAWAIFKAL